MIPVPTIATNCEFGREGMNRLPAVRVVAETSIGDFPAILSYWQPSAAEIERIKAGCLVRLTIIGERMPAVTLDVALPSEE